MPEAARQHQRAGRRVRARRGVELAGRSGQRVLGDDARGGEGAGDEIDSPAAVGAVAPDRAELAADAAQHRGIADQAGRRRRRTRQALTDDASEADQGEQAAEPGDNHARGDERPRPRRRPVDVGEGRGGCITDIGRVARHQRGDPDHLVGQGESAFHALRRGVLARDPGLDAVRQPTGPAAAHPR